MVVFNWAFRYYQSTYLEIFQEDKFEIEVREVFYMSGTNYINNMYLIYDCITNDSEILLSNILKPSVRLLGEGDTVWVIINNEKMDWLDKNSCD